MDKKHFDSSTSISAAVGILFLADRFPACIRGDLGYGTRIRQNSNLNQFKTMLYDKNVLEELVTNLINFSSFTIVIK